jgi:hypothetical protein
MDAKERIVSKLLLQHRCQFCSSPYAPESRIILARRREVWLVMASCSLCQQKDTFIIQFPSRVRGRRITSYRLSRPETPAPLARALPVQAEQEATAPVPIGLDDVLDMREFLATFDGDFQRLFAEVE